MPWIQNASTTPLFANTGTVPDMTDSLLDWFQPMTFGFVTKTVQDYQVVEVQQQITFMGIWMPLSGRELQMKPEGERQWNWIHLFSDATLNLITDDVITYITRNHSTDNPDASMNYTPLQYRIMVKKQYQLYQYIEWHLVQDYSGSGPTPS